MKKFLEKLFTNVYELIEKSDDTRSNKLRYQIGEAITTFYISNKEAIKTGVKVSDSDIIEIYDSRGLDKKGINTDIYKVKSPWDKIKIALSEAIIKKDGSDGYSVSIFLLFSFLSLPFSIDTGIKDDDVAVIREPTIPKLNPV